jgi:tetratricopeptide (TPR) repeat protein
MTWEDAKKEALHAQQEGRSDAAEGAWRKAVEAARAFQQPDPRLCQSLEALANCLQKSRPNEAIDALNESLDLKKQALGESHSAVAALQNQLARLYYQCRDYSNARAMGEACISSSEKAYGESSAEVAAISLNVAYINHKDKKLDRAEKHYQRAMTLRTKLLGAKHQDTMVVLRDYAKLLREMHRDAEADHLDACVKGTITGSWKAITLDEANRLLKHCTFCNGRINGDDRCTRCGAMVTANM